MSYSVEDPGFVNVQAKPFLRLKLYMAYVKLMLELYDRGMFRLYNGSEMTMSTCFIS